MAMSSGEVRGGVAEINVTPLIDVLLVLLILFMVIVPALPHGLESAVPQPAKGAAEPSVGPVMLEVRLATGAAGAAYVYRVDGRPVELVALGEALRSKLGVRQERGLLVAADRGLTYDVVAQAIGVAREAGAWPIGIVGKEFADRQ